MAKFIYDYYSGERSEQFRFLKIPKVFFEDPDYRGITDEQYENRMLLQNVMVRNGFAPIDCEWWHFTLKNEPYPDTFFEFPVSSQYLRR